MYAWAFFYVIKRRKRIGKIETTELGDSDPEDAGDDGDAKENVAIDCEQLKNAFKHVGKFMINMFAVYVLEYIITTGWADRAWRADISPTDKNWFHQNAYKVLYTTYQIGVFCSRTSIQCFRFPWVTLLTLLQAVFFMLWMFIAIYPDWLEIYYQIILMLFVGCMGGCSYSNCMYYVLECKTLSKNQKEVTINIGSMFYDGGILMATITS